MDAAEEKRLLHILRAAQGEPALLALVPLDLSFADAPQDERDRLRDALIAAAVPHWFDGPFLAALLATSQDEACDLIGKLRRLTNVETFPARGDSACNVHEASRLALRQHLSTQRPDLWQTYAQRAHEHLATGKETHERIEALYHLFAANAEASVAACESLDNSLRGNPANCAALCLALRELSNDGWLTGAALVEALRTPLWYRASRGEVSQLAGEARALLDLAQRHGHASRVADAHRLLGDMHESHGELPLAHACFTESLRFYRNLVSSDLANKAWQRDLSVTLNRLGDLALKQSNVDGALRYFTEGKTIRERLFANDPDNPAWHRALAASFSKLGGLAKVQGDLAGAEGCFTESKTIRERLVASDPSNAAWQRDLSTAFSRLGEVALEQDRLGEALHSFAESKAIIARFVASDPANAKWQRDFAWLLNRIGDLAIAQGDLSKALGCYSESKSICERFATSDPTNAEWQRELSFCCRKLADLHEKSGQTSAAKGWWERAYETLADMQQRGLHLSPEDLCFLEQLRATEGLK